MVPFEKTLPFLLRKFLFVIRWKLRNDILKHFGFFSFFLFVHLDFYIFVLDFKIVTYSDTNRVNGVSPSRAFQELQ